MKKSCVHLSRFNWRCLGFQVGVCFDAVPSNVTFLHGPLYDESNRGEVTVTPKIDDVPAQEKATDGTEKTHDLITPDYLRITLLMDAAKCKVCLKRIVLESNY